MRRLVPALCALSLAAALTGVGASMAFAGAPPKITLTPKHLSFGTVALAGSATRTLTITNATDSWVSYEGAHWPNFDHPGLAYPLGIWHDDAVFPCDEIAPRSDCTLTFKYIPPDAGRFESRFWITYGDGTSSWTTKPVRMVGTGV